VTPSTRCPAAAQWGDDIRVMLCWKFVNMCMSCRSEKGDSVDQVPSCGGSSGDITHLLHLRLRNVWRGACAASTQATPLDQVPSCRTCQRQTNGNPKVVGAVLQDCLCLAGACFATLQCDTGAHGCLY